MPPCNRWRITAVPVVRVAVLPFANLGADPEQAFLADGMTQVLITHLGRLNPAALAVIGRTSVLRYKDGDTVGSKNKTDVRSGAQARRFRVPRCGGQMR